MLWFVCPELNARPLSTGGLTEYLLNEYCNSLGEATVEIQTQAGGAAKVESKIVGKAGAKEVECR